MKGKKKLAGVFPILLLLVFLFLWVKISMVQQNRAEVVLPSDAWESLAESSITQKESVFVYQDVIPYATTAASENEVLPESTKKESYIVENTPVLLPETKEESVDVMAGQEAPLPLVTEFRDAYEVILPSETQKKGSSSTDKPALVTGFSGTLPLALPLTSPNVSDEPIEAVYVATAYNLDFPSRPGLSKAALQAELDAMVDNALSRGVNTILFQVRPASDALYRSSIFPVSRYLALTEGGAMALDPLAYLIEKAHEKGIKVHAWINPFRVRSASETDTQLSANNPARQNPSLTFCVDGARYYNPALEDVHTLVIEGVREILLNYDVDGILFDDYFYPEGITSEDAAAYRAYQKAGGSLSLGDFRRDNINRLIQSVYAAIKTIRPSCLFGVSPRGIWRNACDDPMGSDTLGGAAYDAIYCDALAWVRGGYLDYLSPQIYWGFDHAVAPFATLADWWHEALKGSGVKLCVSLATYSLSDWEIKEQKAYLAALSNYGGVAYYRYGTFVGE